MDDPILIGLNIRHYQALLKTELADETRTVVQRLLGDAEIDLANAQGELRRKRARARDGRDV